MREDHYAIKSAAIRDGAFNFGAHWYLEIFKHHNVIIVLYTVDGVS